MLGQLVELMFSRFFEVVKFIVASDKIKFLPFYCGYIVFKLYLFFSILSI